MNITINNKCFQIHRLVALVYINNNDIDNKNVVNHIDENKINNIIENLEWCIPSQNKFHSTKTKKIQALKNNASKYDNEILTFDSCADVINWLKENNIREKVSEPPIRQSCQSKFKKAYDIKFWYIT